MGIIFKFIQICQKLCVEVQSVEQSSEQVDPIIQPMSNSEVKIKYQETLLDTTQMLMLTTNIFPTFNNKFISWNLSSKFLRKKLLKTRKNRELVASSMMKNQVINILTCLRPSICK